MSFIPKLVAIFIQWIIFSTLFTQTRSHSGHDHAVDPFYGGCGTTSTCLGLMPEKSKLVSCTSTACAASLVITPPFSDEEKDQSIHFQMKLNLNEYSYMAVGLTLKSKMNEMLVMECLVNANASVYSFLSWNPASPAGKPTPSNPFSPPVRIHGEFLDPYEEHVDEATNSTANSTKPEGFTIINPNREDEAAICYFMLAKKFSITLPTTAQVISFDLEKPTYNVAVVLGATTDSDESCPYIKLPAKVQIEGEPSLCKHQVVGVRKFNLLEIQEQTEEDYGLLNKLHAYLMILAYMTLMPIATIIARYFKETWSKKTLFGRKIWFPIHVGLLYSALACTIVAYICQAIYHEVAWPDGIHAPNGPTHALIGAISMVLLLSQTILPWLIPVCHSMHKIYSTTHAIVGSVCYGLGILNIILTPMIMPDAMQCEVIFVTFLWLGTHFVLYWLFGTSLLIHDYQSSAVHHRWRALFSYPMKIQIPNAPGKKNRIIFLGLFILFSVLINLMMAFQIFFPMDDEGCKLYMKEENVTGDGHATTPDPGEEPVRWVHG